MGKGLKLKVRAFWGLIPTFEEVAREKLLGGTFLPPIVNGVKISDLLEFLVMLLFFSFVLTRKSFAESCKIMETSMREILF